MPAKKKKPAPAAEPRPNTGPDAEAPTEQETEVTRRVRLKLNRADTEEATKDLLDKMKERDGIEQARAEANKVYRSELKEKDEQINELRTKLELGEWQELPCRQIMDLKKKKVRVILIATGDEIENRPMTEEERQATLF